MIKHLEISRNIKASPLDVWNAVSDVTRMGEWSPECHTCEWNEGVNGLAVGARFTGHNRVGDKEWTTEAEVTACVPGERFAFDGVFGDLRFSSWAYVIEPTAEGCRVTQTWDDGRPDDVIEFTVGITGVADRGEHNKQNMAVTLERLAAAVE